MTDKIDNLRGVKSLCVLIRTDENNAAALYRDRLSFGLLLVDCVDVPIGKDEINIDSTPLGFA